VLRNRIRLRLPLGKKNNVGGNVEKNSVGSNGEHSLICLTPDGRGSNAVDSAYLTIQEL